MPGSKFPDSRTRAKIERFNVFSIILTIFLYFFVLNKVVADYKLNKKIKDRLLLSVERDSKPHMSALRTRCHNTSHDATQKKCLEEVYVNQMAISPLSVVSFFIFFTFYSLIFFKHALNSAGQHFKNRNSVGEKFK